jgi:hypothetical protein
MPLRVVVKKRAIWSLLSSAHVVPIPGKSHAHGQVEPVLAGDTSKCAECSRRKTKVELLQVLSAGECPI